MRFAHLAGFLAFVIVGSSGMALAQSARDEESRERAENNNPESPQIRRLGEMPGKKMTWLGVSVEPVSQPLMHHLKLQPGVGLIVEQVIPGSPAQKAGLEEYDILQKFSDQLLVNPEQLSALVHMHKSGDTVTLGVIHQGEPKELKVTLGEQAGELSYNPGFERGGALGQGQGWTNVPGGGFPQRQIEKQLRDLKGHVHEMKIELPQITVDVDGDQPRVTAKDAKGNVIFSKSWKMQFGNDKSPVSVHMSVESDDREDGARANPGQNPGVRKPEPRSPELRNPEPKKPAPLGTNEEK
jgi:copper chaperone CopZ